MKSGNETCVITIKDVPVGLTACEDIWFPGPMEQAAKAGARMIINVNASPYHINKTRERVEILQKRVSENPMPIMYVNLLGGQDELVFDGESFVIDAAGKVCNRAPAFEEGVYLAPAQFEGMFISAAHTQQDLEITLEKAESVFRKMK